MSQEAVEAEAVGATAQQPEPSETARAAEAALKDLIQHMRMRGQAKVAVREDEERVELVVTGAEAALLVGKKGQTLDALQYLLNRMVGKQLGEHKLIAVNSDGYRERREAALVELANRLRDKARAEGKVVALNPMSARDRRIIHLTLRDDPSVCTRSEGEGEERRLLIEPTDG